MLGAVEDAVEYTVTVANGATDRELPAVQAWLAATGAPARTRRAPAPPEPAQLGVAGDALLVTLAPGGVAIAVIGAIISWLRGRRSEVTLRITTGKGRTAEVTARGLRDMDADGVARLVAETVAALEPATVTALEPAREPGPEPGRGLAVEPPALGSDPAVD